MSIELHHVQSDWLLLFLVIVVLPFAACQAVAFDAFITVAKFQMDSTKMPYADCVSICDLKSRYHSMPDNLPVYSVKWIHQSNKLISNKWTNAQRETMTRKNRNESTNKYIHSRIVVCLPFSERSNNIYIYNQLLSREHSLNIKTDLKHVFDANILNSEILAVVIYCSRNKSRRVPSEWALPVCEV